MTKLERLIDEYANAYRAMCRLDGLSNLDPRVVEALRRIDVTYDALRAEIREFGLRVAAEADSLWGDMNKSAHAKIVDAELAREQ